MQLDAVSVKDHQAEPIECQKSFKMLTCLAACERLSPRPLPSDCSDACVIISSKSRIPSLKKTLDNAERMVSYRSTEVPLCIDEIHWRADTLIGQSAYSSKLQAINRSVTSVHQSHLCYLIMPKIDTFRNPRNIAPCRAERTSAPVRPVFWVLLKTEIVLSISFPPRE